MCRTSLLLALVGFQLAVSSPTTDQHHLELKKHFDHLAYIADYGCHHPTPRVYPVHELLTECKIHGKAYFPDVTVLHRCTGAGYCDSGNVCVPTNVNLVHVPFKVTYLEDMEHHKKGTWSMEFYKLENHTDCGCASHADHKPIYYKHMVNFPSRPDKVYPQVPIYEEDYEQRPDVPKENENNYEQRVQPIPVPKDPYEQRVETSSVPKDPYEQRVETSSVPEVDLQVSTTSTEKMEYGRHL